MKLAVFGARGCAKEVEWLLSDLNKFENSNYEISCFVDKHESNLPFIEKPIIAEDVFLSSLNPDSPQSLILAIAEPRVRYSIGCKILSQYPWVNLPNLMHPHHNVDLREGRFEHGLGNIFCFGSVVMPDTKIGNFLYQSVHTSIGHDCVIGDSMSLFPGAKISGNVSVGNKVLVGAGATIKENVQICDDVTIGAGALVIHSITEPGVYVGVPARKIK